MATRRSALGTLPDPIHGLHTHEGRHYLSVDALIEGFWIADQMQTIVYANPALCAMLHCTSEELVGRSAASLADEPDLARLLEEIARRRGGEVGLYGMAWRGKGGRRVHTIVSARPVFDRSGSFRGSLALLLDTTEREDTLRFHRSLAQNLPGAIYRLPAEASAPTQLFEENIARMTGHPFAEIRRSTVHPMYPLIVREHRPRVRAAIRRAVANRSPYRLEYGLRHRDGSVRYVLDCGQPDADGGELRHIDGVILDITAQKRLEQKLRASEQELRHLSTRLLVAQEEERAAIARELHDGVSQSLIGVQVRLDRAHQPSGAPPAEWLAEIRSILQHAISELERISAGLRPSILDDLGLPPALAWLCRQFRAIAPGLELQLKVNLMDGEVHQAIALQIYRIVQESLSNVVKHAGATSAIVRLTRSGPRIVLEISDNGSGFDPEAAALARIINPERGFGLQSMRQRATLSRGVFALHSAFGNGTTIRIEWPSDALSS